MLGTQGANLLLTGFGGGLVGDIANQLITTNGLNYIKDYSFKGTLAGISDDITYQYLSNGITRNEKGQITGYNTNQAIDNYNVVQTLKSDSIGAIMAPIGAKIVESSIVKFGLKSKIIINV